MINHFLRTKSLPYNDGNSTVIETDAILSAAATLDIGPGVKAQDLHRDDFIWQQTHSVEVEEGREYQMGSDVSMGLLVPGVNTTKANGASLVGIEILPSFLPSFMSCFLFSLLRRLMVIVS